MANVLWIDENVGPWKATVHLTPDGDAEISLPEEVAALVDEDSDIAEFRWAKTGELVVDFKKAEDSSIQTKPD